MGKISDIQLRAQAAILAKEGYSCSRIATKLRCSKSWVSKSICVKKTTYASSSGQKRNRSSNDTV